MTRIELMNADKMRNEARKDAENAKEELEDFLLFRFQELRKE